MTKQHSTRIYFKPPNRIEQVLMRWGLKKQAVYKVVKSPRWDDFERRKK